MGEGCDAWMLWLEQVVLERVVNLGDNFTIDYRDSMWAPIIKAYAAGSTQRAISSDGSHV